MTTLRCSTVRPLLAAYRDRELREERELAVRAHLRTCSECSEELDTLHLLGETLRRASHNRLEAHDEEIVSLHNRVIAAVQAHRAQSRERWLDDLHLVWAMAGATVASIACLFAALGVMRLALREVPSSMAAVIGALGDPGSDRNPMRVDGRMLLPSLDNAVPAVVVSPGEAMLALSAIVTREGRVSQVELVMPEAGGLPQADAVLQLLDAAAQTRFEPARAGGAPIAVNVIWLMAQTTVVGKETLDPPGARRVRRLQTPPPVPPVVPAADPISQVPASATVAA
jgi:hypothetical protein